MNAPPPPDRPAQGRWWNGAPGRVHGAVFLIVAIGLLGSLFLVWDTITSERDERAQAGRTMEVMSALRDIDRAALNAETGQLGYFITLDRDYLASYEMGRALYARARRRLQQLVDADGSAQQQALLTQIEQHGDAKFAAHAKAVTLVREGRILDAQQVILSGQAMREMQALRHALNEMEATEQAILSRAGKEAAVNEKRVLPELGLVMFAIMVALVLGFWQSLRAARNEAQAARAQELSEAKDRADLLAHELNHRVKNLFAVILAIVQMSARNRPEAQETVSVIGARIRALLDAHDATQGGQDSEDGEAELRVLIDKVLAPYLSSQNAVTIDGPPVRLDLRQATPVGLVLHELTTNAVKYGAWSQDGGEIRIDWTVSDGPDGREFRLVWREICPHPMEPGERKGFGSMLMQSSARQLSGTIERRFEADGAVIEMNMPYR